jgi:hypothetical protein
MVRTVNYMVALIDDEVARLFVTNGLDEALTFNYGEGSNDSQQKIDGEAKTKIIKLACRLALKG